MSAECLVTTVLKLYLRGKTEPKCLQCVDGTYARAEVQIIPEKNIEKVRPDKKLRLLAKFDALRIMHDELQQAYVEVEGNDRYEGPLFQDFSLTNIVDASDTTLPDRVLIAILSAHSKPLDTQYIRDVQPFLEIERLDDRYFDKYPRQGPSGKAD